MKRYLYNPALRFTLPVVLENIISVVTTILFSSFIGTISSSALAAVGMANTCLSMLVSVFSLLTTGAAVLTARLVGAGDRAEASHTVEQSLFLSVSTSVLFAAICFAVAPGVMRLLMPNAEAQLFQEAALAFRVKALSFPGLIIYSVMVSVMRASGDSRRAMYVVTLVNLVQVFFAWLLIGPMRMNVVGVGLADTLGRTSGAVAASIAVLRHGQNFEVRLKNVLRPRWETCARILRVGLPVSVESVFGQLAALVENTMLISLGTLQASVYQVVGALNTYTALPQLITANITVTLIGQLIGARAYERAKKTGRVIWWVGVAVTALIAVCIWLFAPQLAKQFTAEEAVIQHVSRLMVMMIALELMAVSINVVDPVLRTGGDAKYVMAVTLLSIWLIRVPLTWLFAFQLKLGVDGVFLASLISLTVRAMLGLIRYRKYKWMYKKL